jgi:hypothetical protein
MHNIQPFMNLQKMTFALWKFKLSTIELQTFRDVIDLYTVKPRFTAPQFTADPDLPPQILCSQHFVRFFDKKRISKFYLSKLLILVAGVKQAC